MKISKTTICTAMLLSVLQVPLGHAANIQLNTDTTARIPFTAEIEWSGGLGTRLLTKCAACRNATGACSTGTDRPQYVYNARVVSGSTRLKGNGDGVWSLTGGPGKIVVTGVCSGFDGAYSGVGIEYQNDNPTEGAVTNVTYWTDQGTAVSGPLRNRVMWYAPIRTFGKPKPSTLQAHVLDRITLNANSSATILDQVQGNGRAHVLFYYQNLPKTFQCAVNGNAGQLSTIGQGDTVVCEYVGNSVGMVSGNLILDLAMI